MEAGAAYSVNVKMRVDYTVRLVLLVCITC